MLLKHKVAVIHGAGGAIGGEVARTFAREGAKVFLSGRRLAVVEAVAQEIVAAGGEAEAATVDALDEDAVEQYSASVAKEAGRIDVALNAIGFRAVQGVPLVGLSREDFVAPIVTWTTAQFLTARAAARHMVQKRAGVILTLSASPARLAIASTAGFGVACAAIEGLHARWPLSSVRKESVSSASDRTGSATRSAKIRTSPWVGMSFEPSSRT